VGVVEQAVEVARLGEVVVVDRGVESVDDRLAEVPRRVGVLLGIGLGRAGPMVLGQ
jgi:hypothetical protein